MRIGQFKIENEALNQQHIQKFLSELTIKMTKELHNCMLIVAEFDEFDDINEVTEDVPIYSIKFYMCNDGLVRMPVERWK